MAKNTAKPKAVDIFEKHQVAIDATYVRPIPIADPPPTISVVLKIKDALELAASLHRYANEIAAKQHGGPEVAVMFQLNQRNSTFGIEGWDFVVKQKPLTVDEALAAVRNK